MTDKQGSNVFGIPPGSDFPKMLHRGLVGRFTDPLHLARTTLLLNTQRMARRVKAAFDDGPAVLTPKIGLITNPTKGSFLPEVPPAVPPLRRRLETSQLVAGLLDSQPDLAPRASLFDLSDSLSALMEEMQGEGVEPRVLHQLDISDESGHWRRALSFLQIVQHYFDDNSQTPDRESRHRRTVEQLIDHWAQSPPKNPIVIAGSTASRGTTMLLMKAVAQMPNGMLVLPGFDFDMPPAAWADLNDALTAEDHPQYRYAKLVQELGLTPQDVSPWTADAPPCPERNRMVSLALRPAPVTDRWLSEGPKLTGLAKAMADVTLVEAPSKREEAMAIALRLRHSAEQGQTTALITPDRMLTRQVSATLSRWKIIPDDSAGIPLQLTAPGRFLRHVGALLFRKLTSEALLTLLMHPLTHTGGNRGPHLRYARELELHIRKTGLPFPTAEELLIWASLRDEPDAMDWATWVVDCFLDQEIVQARPLSALLRAHLDLSEKIANGSTLDQESELWQKDAGRAAATVVGELEAEAGYGGTLKPSDYADLFGAVLSQGEVRNPDSPHPNILIWGTLEARVQGADLVILGGLNEGSWPEAPSPDPWLNRKMRFDAGLLLPERRIGLSAHDFQQALGAPQVWMTRSIRSDDAETVPSRWVNRMNNLLNGLSDQGGKQALEDARSRGDHWLAMVRKLETPGTTPPAPRPSPCPPVPARPRRLSVTEIKRLIRDPYAIYAKHVLRLRPLDPLMSAPDALLRGIVTHSVLEQFVHDSRDDDTVLTADHLRTIATQILAAKVPWPDTRTLWDARIARMADWFVETEKARRSRARPTYFEIKGQAQLPDLDFTLVGTADRIDMDDRGFAHIYDYKTGTIPSKKQQASFDKQLLLEAAMIEQGGFADIGPAEVASAQFVGVGNKPKEETAPLSEETPDIVWDKFHRLIAQYFDPAQGYTARRALFQKAEATDYDQLSRFGEWDATAEPTKQVLL